MKYIFVLLASLSVTVYSQFEGMALHGVPFEQNPHFLFSSADDTVIYGTWSQLADYPMALFGVNCYYWPETGRIFTCGGSTAQGVRQKACYWYDPVSNMYSSADSLPKPRWSGKLVRVRQALYLVGSVDSFTVPDGIIYRYSPSQNQWVIKDTMPAPYLHESSVCVFNDSLIICIGGSTTSFAGTTNVVRAYNPFKDKWLSAGNLPVNNTTGHAECRMADSSVVLVGGYGATFNNVVYHGKIVYSPAHDSLQDSIRITWTASALNDTTIFRTGVYRVGGGNAGEWMLFGPALRNSTTYNTIYTLGLTAPDTMYWKRLVPDIPDTAGNRPSLAVKYDTDSVWIFLFSGSKGFTTVRSSYRFSYARPAPIGLKQIAEIVPDEFMLYQNYPNPFNPVTRIRFSVQDDAHQQPVRVAVYDILGREIAMLVNNKLNAGIYEVEWNGNGHPSGIYFCRLTVESAGSAVIMKTQKMVLVK